MLRARSLPRRTALVLAVLAGLLCLPAAAHAAVGQPAGRADAGHATVRTAVAAPSASGGICGVPGIGDIASLFGYCTLGQSGVLGAINNLCTPSLPDPEPADSGIDSMVTPPDTGKQPATLYDQYGVSGQNWNATNLQCSDMTSLIGNNVAGMVFDVAKSIDRVTITVYQSAAGDGIVSWLRDVTDRLISGIGNAIYFPYVAAVVIIGAIWLAWQGLIRKRGTRTIEGIVWMVIACAAALFLIGRPAAVTGAGTSVSDGISQALNTAFAKLPSPGPSSCVPVQKGDPQVQPSSYGYTAGSTVVNQNADELWTVLVCKPWLIGEFGTASYSAPGGKPTAVNAYARQLLWAQAFAANEKPSTALLQAKQATYAGIATSIQQNDPAIYPLFQGKEWTTRLEIAFAALFAAAVAGVLILLISVTLILLKLGFLLLLIVGPFFLLIGTHPGFGRVVAMRWAEMLVGVLLKQAAVALVLSLLLYCYALIMGTSDAVLSWALKILMIALVTLAAFIYRKPFQHLFSAVGYGMIGARERADADLARAGETARGNTLAAATAAVPGVAAYRAARWARQNPAHAATLALGAAAAAGAGAAAAGLSSPAELAAVRVQPDGAAAPDGAVPDGPAGADAADGTGGRPGPGARARAWAGTVAEAGATEPPPLVLPKRGTAAASPSSVRAPGSTVRLNGAAADGGPPAARSPAPPPARPGGPRAGAGTGPASGGSGGAAARSSPWRLGTGGRRPEDAAAGPVPPARSGGGAPGPAAGRWPGRPARSAPPHQPAPGRQPASARQPAQERQARPARQPAPGRQPASARQPAPERQAASARQPAPERQARPTRQPALPSASGWAPARRPAPPAARRPRPAGQPGPDSAGHPPAQGRGGPGPRGESGAAPLAGPSPAERREPAGPFWLHPIRRRK